MALHTHVYKPYNNNYSFHNMFLVISCCMIPRCLVRCYKVCNAPQATAVLMKSPFVGKGVITGVDMSFKYMIVYSSGMVNIK